MLTRTCARVVRTTGLASRGNQTAGLAGSRSIVVAVCCDNGCGMAADGQLSDERWTRGRDRGDNGTMIKLGRESIVGGQERVTVE